MNWQVLVSRVSSASWSFLQCTGSNFHEPRIPKYSHHTLPLSLITRPISMWDIWEDRQHRKLGRWKTHEEGKRMFSKLPIWFASPDSPDPWDLVQKPSVCLFVPWRSPEEPAERARWHRTAYRCGMPWLWKNSHGLSIGLRKISYPRDRNHYRPYRESKKQVLVWQLLSSTPILSPTAPKLYHGQEVGKMTKSLKVNEYFQ